MPGLNLQSHREAEDLRGRTNPFTCHELLGRDCAYKTHKEPQETKSRPVRPQVAVAASAAHLTLVYAPKLQKKTKSSSTLRQECLPSVAEGVLNHVADSSALIWEQTVSSLADMTLEEDEKDKEDTCTDTDDVTEEIKEHLKETVTFSIQHVHNDYSIYENVCTSPDKFPHVIEIYNFPAFYKTDDLLDAFTEYSDGGLKIEWVDNTHALGVFSSETAALHALSICHPTLKARSLAQGSKSAIGKAMRRAEFIQPVKERPRTDCAVARRMVTRALGLQGRGRVQRY